MPIPIYDQDGNLIHPAIDIGALTQNTPQVQNYTPVPDAQKMQSIPAPQVSAPQAPQVNLQNLMPVQLQQPKPTITPDKASPGESKIAQLVPPDINDPDFKNSKVRTFLNALAGGLAGASGGPKVGYEIGSQLRDQKYNRALGQYNKQLALSQDQSKASQDQFERGYKLADLTQRAKTADSLNVYREGQLEGKDKDRDLKNLDLQRKQKQDETRAKYLKWREDNPKLTDTQFLLSLPSEEQQDAIQIVHDINAAKRESSKDKAADATAVTEARINAEADNRNTLAANSAAKAGATARAGTTARINAETTEDAIKKQANLETAKKTAASDATLSAQEKNTLDGAREIQRITPTVDSLLSSVIKSGKMKTLEPRWNEFMTGKIGEGDPELTQLRTHLGFIQSKLAQIHTRGGTISAQKKFEDLINGKVMNGATLQSALKAAKLWIDEYAKDPRKYNDPEYYSKDLKGSQGKFEVIK